MWYSDCDTLMPLWLCVNHGVRMKCHERVLISVLKYSHYSSKFHTNDSLLISLSSHTDKYHNWTHRLSNIPHIFINNHLVYSVLFSTTQRYNEYPMQLLPFKDFHLTQKQRGSCLPVNIDILPNVTWRRALDRNGRTLWWHSWILATFGEGRSLQLVGGNWPFLVTDQDNEICGAL